MSEKPTAEANQKNNERLIAEIVADQVARERNARMSYSIAHGWTVSGLAPKLEIRLEGGDIGKVHALALEIERLILAFGEANPPSETGVPTKPHFLPADSQRANP